MTAVPEWMCPPRPDGWYADDLDQLSQAPRHTELIDGVLVLRLSREEAWHGRVVSALLLALAAQAPAGIEVERERTIRLDERTRVEPDLLAARPARHGPDRRFYVPDQVLLAIEVASPESAHRDRTVKLRKYAEAGIAHYWRVEEDDAGLPVVHAYELDEPTRSYAPSGVHRRAICTKTPFPIELVLDKLMAGRRS
ncbi:Uma2 family endonuclease [Actinoplanes sp. RD1]|uniref:Uma2 family endonuclease n=1 Tax=Actinoplanes sp. RD1 TaxID=3064538 RepID=UPI002742135F|nr:Uma2 family endonuclease [Actinoplanes sp. RD1]